MIKHYTDSYFAGEKLYRMPFQITSHIEGDFAAATVMISLGALLGKVNVLQMIFVMLIEKIYYWINASIVQKHFVANDIGGSIVIHAFGAYFGLACAWVLGPKGSHDTKKVSTNYYSNLIASIGVFF